MDRLHQRDEGAEGQLGDAGKRGLQHDGEGPELQRDHAADDRGGDDAGAHRALARAEPVAADDGTPDQVIADEAAVKGHIPDIRAQRHQPAVGEEETLDREDHDHGQEAGLRPEQRGEQHAAAHVARGTRAGDGIVDHLAREDQRGGDGHRRELLGLVIAFELVDGNAGRRAGGDIHRRGDCGSQQGVCHMHEIHLSYFS